MAGWSPRVIQNPRVDPRLSRIFGAHFDRGIGANDLGRSRTCSIGFVGDGCDDDLTALVTDDRVRRWSTGLNEPDVAEVSFS